MRVKKRQLCTGSYAEGVDKGTIHLCRDEEGGLSWRLIPNETTSRIGPTEKVITFTENPYTPCTGKLEKINTKEKWHRLNAANQFLYLMNRLPEYAIYKGTEIQKRMHHGGASLYFEQTKVRPDYQEKSIGVDQTR